MVQFTTNGILYSIQQTRGWEEQKQIWKILVKPSPTYRRNNFQRQIRWKVIVSSIHWRTSINCPHLILQEDVIISLNSQQRSYSNSLTDYTYNIEFLFQIFRIGSKILTGEIFGQETPKQYRGPNWKLRCTKTSNVQISISKVTIFKTI